MNDTVKPMIVAEARELLLGYVSTLAGGETVALTDALGRALSRPVKAAIPIPPADNSAMDGYACASKDLSGAETRLPISARIYAGATPAPLKPGTAARIMTGAVIPSGADMVVMQERCRADSDSGSVVIFAGAEKGANIRRAGEELAPGRIAVPSGRRLMPEDLALLATIGLAEIPVRRRPKITVVTTGDELVEPGQDLAPGQIYSSNAVMLAGLTRVLGCDCRVLPRVPDTAGATESALREAVIEADLVLTSGGVSVGDTDWVRKTIQRLGRVELWKIAVKPGKPLAFGLVNDIPILGLPGNPVAAYVGFCLFVAPLIRRMLDIEPVFPSPIALSAGFAAAPGPREVYWRVKQVDGTLIAFMHQGSAALTSVSWADGLARVKIEQEVTPGAIVDYFSFSSLLT